MVKAKVISDRLAKARCKEWLESVGFTDVKLAKRQNCDLVAKKAKETYYIEVKYSSKRDGDFFGTVMLTEMFQAISNKEHFMFLVCRGQPEDAGDWWFRLFGVEEFLKCCTLTTPIFLYRLSCKNRSDWKVPEFTNKSAIASDKLIQEMWQDFLRWKSKYQESGEEGSN